MGQQDDKSSGGAPTAAETPAAGTQQEIHEEPKETDKMLAEEEQPTAAAGAAQKEPSTAASTPADGTETKTTTAEHKEVAIDIPAELEQQDNDDKAAKVAKVEREVKPRKIPIGGFKLPGFFTRSKQSKQPADAEGADGELLPNEQKTEEQEEAPGTTEAAAAPAGNGNGKEHEANETTVTGEETQPAVGDADADDSNVQPTRGRRFVPYLRSLFTRERSAQPVAQDEPLQEVVTANGGDADNKSEATAEATALPAEDLENLTVTESTAGDESSAANTTQRSLRERIATFRLPLPQLLSKKKSPTQAPDVELGLTNKAELASMETLDDPLKDQDCAAAPATTKTNGTDEVASAANNTDTKATIANANEAITAAAKEHTTRIRECLASRRLAWCIIGFCILFLIVLLTLMRTQFPVYRPVLLRDGLYVDAVTSCGPVEGLKDEDAFAFRGIPFALPPIDERRWRFAQPNEDIEDCWNGTLLAHNSSEVCSQRNANGDLIGSEDCLYLDVVTPRMHSKYKLPVVVLIGADTLTGPSPGILRPSARYAGSRDVVFVRPNFRLGPFGFLALQSLTKEAHPHSSGNYALSDIIAALQWVQLNIHNFGGDAKSVMLLGHRAGATLVSALTNSKDAEGLFARAWASSPSAVLPGKPLAQSEEQNAAFLETLKCHDLECLRDLAESSVWQATPKDWSYVPTGLPQRNDSAIGAHDWLVLDGQILREQPSASWQKAEKIATTNTPSHPRLVIGTTAHELSTPELHSRSNWTAAEVRTFLQQSSIGDFNLTDEVIARYNATNYRALVSIITDIRSVCPLLLNARQQPSAAFYVASQGAGVDQLAAIGDDILAILGRYDSPTPEQRRYTSAMQQLFYYYIAHGRIPDLKSRRHFLDIGQDALTFEDHPHCNYWISKDFVPRFARPE